VKILKQGLDDNVKALLDQAYPSKPLLDVLNRDISCEKDVIIAFFTINLGVLRESFGGSTNGHTKGPARHS
jgi:hypothetical protein